MNPSPSEASSVEKVSTLDVAALHRSAAVLAESDRHLADVLDRLGPPPLWKRSASFGTFVRIILEQQVSLASAKSTYDKLANNGSGTVTPGQVEDLGQAGLRQLGITRQKSRYLYALARDVNAGEFRIGGLRHRTDDQIRVEITARLGLGQWSADIFLLLALSRPDVLPVGDLALVKGMQELDGGTYEEPQQLVSRAQAWRPYRSVATRMIWQLYLHNRGQSVP